METLQSIIFIEFDVNTKKITFLRNDNIIDYDSDATSIYARVKYKNLSGNTVYLTPSELENYKFSLYTIKPATNNVNVIAGEVTDELKENVYGGVVKFEIPRACTNRLGIVKCEIHINQGNKIIGSRTFTLDVKQSLVTAFDDELLGDEDFPVLKQLILEIQKASNIDDNNRSKITTYSSDKIEDIKEDFNLQIKEKGDRIETVKEDLSLEIKEKVDKTTADNMQTQINNLVLGAVGDGNNAEVVQARGMFNTLNDRLNDSDNKVGKLFKQTEFDTISTALPLVHNTSNESGWLYDNFYLKNTKWADYEYVLVAMEMSVTGLTKDMFLSSITTTGKYDGPFTLSDNYKLLVEDKKITEGEKFIHLSGFHINADKIAEHNDATLMFVQYGNSSDIGNPTITIHNIAIYKAQSSDYSNELNSFYKNGFVKYITCIDYDKDLINKPTINDLEPPIGDIIDDKLSVIRRLLYRNYMKNYNLVSLDFNIIDEGNEDVTKTIEDGYPRFKWTTANTSGNAYLFSTNLNIPNYEYIANHTYLFAIQVHVNEYTTSNETSTAGNITVSNLKPTNASFLTSEIYATYNIIQDIATVGADCNILTYATIDETKLNNAISKNAFNLQFSFNEPGTVIDFTVKNVAVLDVTELNLQTSNQMLERFNKYKYVKNDIMDKIYNIKVREALNASQTDGATGNNKSSIEIWGDSLVAQGYGDYIGEYLDRDVLTKGYGGKTSTYIRDKFLTEADTSKTIIINVGRNNFGEPDVIMQDIKAMVNAIPHFNFLICCPPNGNFGNGEGKGTHAYTQFEIIENRLSKQYGANFLNTRVGTIEEYDMGNVKLIDSFIQPNINGQVTIKVSDASFLTIYNSHDTSLWGEEFMKKIVIGQSIYSVDTYRVDSYDTTTNTLTVTLLENNSGITPGSTVSNGVDSGGLNSVKHLRVLQYADYYCFINDITQSTFRSDGIHMTENGRKCLAKIIARKINSMNI